MAFLPDLAAYGANTAQAKFAYDRAKTSIAQRRAEYQQLYGLKGTYDDKGNLTQSQVDPSNQYGAIQMMKRGQGQELQGAYDEASDRRIGHQGLGAQEESGLRFQHGAESLELGRDFTQSMAGLSQEGVDAEQQYQNAQNAELAARLAAAQMTYDDPGEDFDYRDYGQYFDFGGGPDFDGQQASPAAKMLAGALAGKKYNPQAYVRGGAPANVARAIQKKGLAPKPKAAPAPRYYTYKKDVRLGKGQKLKFKPGKGYYAG